MWLEFLSWAAKELSPSERSLIHSINDIIHKDLCFYKGTVLQILLLWDGHDWKNGVNRTEINKRRINVRALATLRNYDGNRRVEKAIRKTTILQLLFSQFFFFFFFFDVPEQLQLEIVRQGNAGDKGPVITYHRGIGGGVGGFGTKDGETSPIPLLNLISPLFSPLITLDNFREPPPSPPPTSLHPYLPFDVCIYRQLKFIKWYFIFFDKRLQIVSTCIMLRAHAD